MLALTIGGISVANAFVNHDVAVGGGANIFSPAELTINVGDTVTWTNEGGFHNVVSDVLDAEKNPLFSSGAPSTDNWTYTFTFNTPGTYRYVCQPHETIGMVGTITVQETPTAVTLSGLDTLNGDLPIAWYTLIIGALAIGSLICARFLSHSRHV